MNYKKFNDEISLSRLGMGNMRLPILENEPGKPIDYEKGQEIIDYCINKGINYFDTAYIYHDGESEVFLGKALAKYPGDSYYIADKYKLSAKLDYKAQFNEQLNRLNYAVSAFENLGTHILPSVPMILASLLVVRFIAP